MKNTFKIFAVLFILVITSISLNSCTSDDIISSEEPSINKTIPDSNNQGARATRQNGG